MSLVFKRRGNNADGDGKREWARAKSNVVAKFGKSSLRKGRE
jgi:uncharacterized protein (UPF0303 family)